MSQNQSQSSYDQYVKELGAEDDATYCKFEGWRRRGSVCFLILTLTLIALVIFYGGVFEAPLLSYATLWALITTVSIKYSPRFFSPLGVGLLWLIYGCVIYLAFY